MWVDNNPLSRFYGRLYVSWNDFTTPAAAVMSAHSGNGVTWSAPVQVPAASSTFIRDVQLTGSPGTDGTVFLAGMDEGGGLFGNRQNYMYRSADGGATWTGGPIGQPFAAPGDLACGSYFVAIAPIWRYMGWGQPAVGPPHVLHYVYTVHGAGADGGDIYYTRSTDNGATWSHPVKLNTDTGPFAQWMPSLAATPTGRLVASWYDRRNTSDGLSYEYRSRISANGGLTWQPDFRLSDQLIPQPAQPDPNVQPCYAGDYNYDTAAASTVYIAWTDGRVAIDGIPQQDVFFDKVTP